MKKNCEECGKTFETNKFTPYQKYCSEKCNQKHYWRIRRKELDKIQKQKARETIGAICVLCKTKDSYVLCLDHINNDACKDSERWHDDRDKNRWILKYPVEAKKIFQILCWNCNALKYFYPNEYIRRGGKSNSSTGSCLGKS